MLVSDFDFVLPEALIALRPASPRESARLMLVDPAAAIADYTVADLPGLIRPGDIMVFNDTRVIPARLAAVRRRATGAGAALEILLHQRLAATRWKAFVRPAKRVAAGDILRFGADERLTATVEAKGEGGEITLTFAGFAGEVDAAIAAIGHMPLPPYIATKRPDDAQDRRDYQTIYARADGAVAAPTAGLHFTPALLDALDKSGVEHAFVTLHVGAGTFLPVKVEDTDDHRMHAENGEISAETAARLNAARARGGRIIAVGTTSLRLLESAVGADGEIRPFSGETAIFITPGYRFGAVDGLITNFHLPRSTLLMLVSAFAGKARMAAAYAHAVERGYRFYSYGDASLLWRDPA